MGIHFKPGRRTLRIPALFTILVISIIIGIALLIFVIQLINEQFSKDQNRWNRMNCIQIVLFENSKEYDTLDEFEHKEFHKALKSCKRART